METNGLKIQNIKAGTLFGYNQGIRDHYDKTDAVFNDSLFSDYIKSHGLNVWHEKSTRDIICLDFDFGSRSYEEELAHLKKQFAGFEEDPNRSEEDKQRIRDIFANVEKNKDNYFKLSKEEIRELYYENGVDVDYFTRDKNRNISGKKTIHYKMLYRNSSKAKIGQVMFINAKLYKNAYNWLTMGLGDKMPVDNAKIVEMSAYMPLTTSTIVGKFYCPVEDILILKDQESFFRTMAKVVKAEDYVAQEKVIDEEATEQAKQKAIKNGKFLKDGITPKYNKRYKKIDVIKKKCVVVDEETEVKNTMWDGEALIESDILPEWVNGMALLRNHFFKACGVRTYIQKFFHDWCEKTGNDYDTYEVVDMFGVSHKLKDIKIITTDNAIKWKKFMDIMGDTPADAYKYWCDKINADGSYFGIVKTDHPSKLDNVQQMSYQMINTLPCGLDDIKELAQTSINYVEKLKEDDDAYNEFLKKYKTEVNHYAMLSAVYEQNHEIMKAKWFRYDKSSVINTYVDRLRSGKITINADNLTIFGNPFALLLYSVGDNWEDDPTLNYEDGVIQCYTLRFNDGEYLCGIRNPHNSPNNICYLHNRYSEEWNRYFQFSDNILAVNCIHTDIQDRANGCDFDSDFFFVTNNNVMVKCAKIAYEQYPTIVNKLQESGLTYKNTMSEYARMDNKFSQSRLGIGESSNQAQLAMTYYWTNPSKELYDNFVILSVLAQIIIDGCKREFEVDGVEEIKRIKKLPCMQQYEEIIDEDGNTIKIKKDFPLFMRYTRRISYMKNGKQLDWDIVTEERHKLTARISDAYNCPMNYLQIALDGIKRMSYTKTIPNEQFIVEKNGNGNTRQISKVLSLCNELELFNNIEDDIDNYLYKLRETVDAMSKIKVSNINTIIRLIEIALNTSNLGRKRAETCKYSRTILKLLYKVQPEKFLSCFLSQN